MATFKPVVFRSKNSTHIKSDGTSNIKIKIYHNSDSQYIPTELYIKPEYMAKSGEVVPEHPDSDYLNYELGEVVQKYRRAALKLGGFKLKQISCKSLKKYIIKSCDPKSEFIDFVEFSREVIAETKKKKTACWYEDSLNALTWFYKTEKINVLDITSSKLKLFIKQLRKSGRKEKPLEPGSINNYLRGIRALFNKCKLEYNDDDAGIIRIPHDPFKKVEIPQYKRKRKNVGVSELLTIRHFDASTFREQLGRDVFFMQFYLMGININDLLKLEDPVSGRVEYERSKTDTDSNVNNFTLSIKIEPELQLLFDQYSNGSFLSVIRDRYSDVEYFNKAVNIGLKSICARVRNSQIKENGISTFPEKVTTNWARHTWASLARNKAGIPKADIDFCLGHVNNDHKMADIYIEEDYSIFDKSNREVLNLIK